MVYACNVFDACVVSLFPGGCPAVVSVAVVRNLEDYLNLNSTNTDNKY